MRTTPAKEFAYSFWALAFMLPVMAAEFYISPLGSATGNGNADRPWDLQTALLHPASLKPGDTLWMRGGVYRQGDGPTQFVSRLAGALGAPIIVRQHPGERATIDGGILHDRGGWTYYWGFEVINSYPQRVTREVGSDPTNFVQIRNGQPVNVSMTGLDMRVPGIKLINLIIHDALGSGIFLNSNAKNPEVYGVLSFYNGWQGCDRGHGHGIYVQSTAPYGARIENSLFFANYGLGIHAYGTAASVDNVSLTGNAAFFNGVLARRRQGNLFIGREQGPATHSAIIQNCFYDTEGGSEDINIGYVHGLQEAVVRSNYFQTSVIFSSGNQNQTVAGNTFLNATINLNRTNFPDNVYLNNRGTSNVVVVRPNVYEPGRAHIIVYNWEHLQTVPVAASNLLELGAPFEVCSSLDYFGEPVLRGIFTGELLALPMAGLRVTKPIGTGAPASTIPDFHVFVLRQQNHRVGTPLPPPTISIIDDQFIAPNTSTAAIPFTVESTHAPVEQLTLSVHSSNPHLLPNSQLQIAGSGSARTLKLHPAQYAIGESTVTLTVSDGFAGATTTFTVFVSPLYPSPDIAEPAPLEPTPTDSAPPLVLLGNGVALLRLQAGPAGTYDAQMTTNLLDWNNLTTATLECEEGIISFLDTAAPGSPVRFYRLCPRTESP